MTLPRRRFPHLAAGAVALPAVSRIARGDGYPSWPVHIVVGFPPGQSADISARLLGQWLSDRLGQPFVIDNKPGASSSVATEFVVRAPPDGYTLLWVATSNYINATFADATMNVRFADLGVTPVPGSPAEFGRLIAAETDKWAKVIMFAGIEPQ